jgi:hypothetical protein
MARKIKVAGRDLHTVEGWIFCCNAGRDEVIRLLMKRGYDVPDMSNGQPVWEEGGYLILEPNEGDRVSLALYLRDGVYYLYAKDPEA